jgi:hypothetical protein
MRPKENPRILRAPNPASHAADKQDKADARRDALRQVGRDLDHVHPHASLLWFGRNVEEALRIVKLGRGGGTKTIGVDVGEGVGTTPLPCFLEVLILRDFKSFAPEVLILGDFKSLFPEVLILVGLKLLRMSEMRKSEIILEVLNLEELRRTNCKNGGN